MNIFNRRKKTKVDPNIPPEVQAYSQAEHRERMGVAWLVGVVSLVLTICILAGLFFGGRWLYRSIAGTGSNESQTRSTTESDQSTKEKEQKKNEGTSTPPDSGQPSSPSTSTPSTSSTPTTTPATGPTIPRTGPDSDE